MIVTCRSCGHEFEYDPPDKVRCPVCGYRYGTRQGPPEIYKSERRKAIETALVVAGLVEFISKILSVSPDKGPNKEELFKTPQDREREEISKVIKETGVFEWKRWVTSKDEKVCEFCQYMADSGIYSVDTEMLSHPNCRCSWEPVVTGLEFPTLEEVRKEV
jgi:rubredoxin